MNGVRDVPLSLPNKSVKVRYATWNNTASKGSDYLATGGVLTFKTGETRKWVTVYVKGDKLKESDETFFLNLTDGSTGRLLARGRGVIRNDD